MNSLMPAKVISVLPRNSNCESIFRYSPPAFIVCLPRVSVTESLSESECGLYACPLVEALLVARTSSPLRATPVVPRASADCEVTVPDSDTCVGS